jgi:hypothetical protein
LPWRAICELRRARGWIIWIKRMTSVRTGETIPPGGARRWRMIANGGNELNVHEGAVGA